MQEVLGIDILGFIEPELLIVPIFLTIIGNLFKKSNMADELIPVILSVISIITVILITREITIMNIITGTILASVSNYYKQLKIQGKKYKENKGGFKY